MIRNSVCDKYCVFVSASDWYALPALAIREVAPCPDLFRVPIADAALAGVCHLRNEFLAVVRLDFLQGHQARNEFAPRQLLILTASTGAWGLLVDKVVALDSMEFSIRPDADRAGGYPDVQQGAATYGDHFVRLLDPHHLYRHAENCLSGNRAANRGLSSIARGPEKACDTSGDKT